MPKRLPMVIDNPQANIAKQRALYNYTVAIQQQNKLASLKQGNGFNHSMIQRIHTASKSCGACGH